MEGQTEVASFGDPGIAGERAEKLPHKWAARWAESLPCATGVYLRRWVLETPWASVRLHHWLSGDDERAHHDHPWGFVTLVLRGGYTDLSPAGGERMTPGSLAYRPPRHRHTVEVDPGGAWTILLTGPIVRRWGFWEGGTKWVKSVKWFHKAGPHVCR